MDCDEEDYARQFAAPHALVGRVYELADHVLDMGRPLAKGPLSRPIGQRRAALSPQSTAPPGIRTPDPLIKSRESDGLKPPVGPDSQGEKGAACECPEGHEAPGNRGDSAPAEIPQEFAEVPGGAVEVSNGGRRSGKQNDKQNDKRASADPQLAEVAAGWPELPEGVKAGILATGRALTGRTQQ